MFALDRGRHTGQAGWWGGGEFRAKLTLEPRSSSKSCPRGQPVWSRGLEPSRGAITGHRSHCQGYAMPRRRSASLTAPGAALRWREGPTSPLCKHLEQLIPPWLWIAPPVATEHPRRAVVTEPATHGGGWYRGRGRQIGRVGRKWRLRSRSCPSKSWIPRDHGPEVLLVPSDHLKPRPGGVFRI